MRRHLPVLAALLGACTGPKLRIASDGEVFVDGARERRLELPFRYYGTTSIAAFPKDLPKGMPDWSKTPVREEVEIAAPAPGWLFPFDLPIELADRLVRGRPDRRVTLVLPEAKDRVLPGFQPAGLLELAARAQAARIAR